MEYKLKVGDFDKLKEENASLLAKKSEADKENKVIKLHSAFVNKNLGTYQ